MVALHRQVDAFSRALMLAPSPLSGPPLRRHLRMLGPRLAWITPRYLPRCEPRLPPALRRAILVDERAKPHARLAQRPHCERLLRARAQWWVCRTGKRRETHAAIDCTNLASPFCIAALPARDLGQAGQPEPIRGLGSATAATMPVCLNAAPAPGFWRNEARAGRFFGWESVGRGHEVHGGGRPQATR